MSDTSKSTRSLLLIDDDAFIGEMVATLLQENGYAVQRMTTGEEGLTEVERLRPDLVLLDIGLPGIDGFEVLEAIQNSETVKGTPVLVLSNFGQKDEVEKSTELGAIDHLVKVNVDPHAIVERINEFFKSK